MISKKFIPAIVYPADIDEDSIEVDPVLRINLGVNVGEKVDVKKAVKCFEPKKVVLAPMRYLPSEYVIASEVKIKEKLLNKPIVLKEILYFDLEYYDKNPVGFKVVEVDSPGLVFLITERTLIDIRLSLTEDPKAFLAYAQGCKVEVRTTLGIFRGLLLGYDNSFNLILDNASFLNLNKEEKCGQIVINGNNVISIKLLEHQ